MTVPITLTVNGRTHGHLVEPWLLLAQFLRDATGAGPVIGCDTSQCAACLVLVDGQPVKSCTMLAVQADGCEVTTAGTRPGDGELPALREASCDIRWSPPKDSSSPLEALDRNVRGIEYRRARSVADALALLSAAPGAALLAGGHSLLPRMKRGMATPTLLIDIGRLSDLRGVSRRGDVLRIGALSTHAGIGASGEVRRGAPALAEAAALAGDPAVRTRATIGGNLACADPASDLAPVLVALDATVVVTGPVGERTIAVDEFLSGAAMANDEMLTAVMLPAVTGGQGCAYERWPHPVSPGAAVGVAALVHVYSGTMTRARVALGGLLPAARRSVTVEGALAGRPAAETAIAQAAAAVTRDLGADVIGDVAVPAGSRARMAPVCLMRAVMAAAARAGLA